MGGMSGGDFSAVGGGWLGLAGRAVWELEELRVLRYLDTCVPWRRFR